MRVNTSFGNQRASSHSRAWGRSSLSMKRRIASRSSSCSSVNGGLIECGVAAARMVEAKQISRGVLLVAVVIGAHLADLPVAEGEPLRAAVEPVFTGLRVAP